METSFLKVVFDKAGLIKVSASGAWTSQNTNMLEAQVQKILDHPEEFSNIQIDVSNITKFDTFGAWLLERLKRELIVQGVQVQISGMKHKNKSIFNEMEQVNLGSNSDDETARPQYFSVTTISNNLILFWKEMSSFLAMFGAAVSATGGLIMQPRHFRLTSSIHQFDRVAWQALPIVLLVTFIIGAIIAQQGFFHFRQFGAELYVVDMIGFLIMREIGVLLVAIVIAGRSGSSFTAELGSMKMSEEIDALKTMGFNPIDVLVLPRILVLIVALPVLTFIGSVTALFGAGLVAVFYGGISPELYLDRLKDVISISHFNVGMIKAPFIGAVIGIIACTEGLQVRGSASSLGQHTTQSVVKSIFMVIFLDGLFALFFSAIRM